MGDEVILLADGGGALVGPAGGAGDRGNGPTGE